MSKAATIDIASVSKVYGTTTAVNAISLKIPAGNVTFVLTSLGEGTTAILATAPPVDLPADDE